MQIHLALWPVPTGVSVPLGLGAWAAVWVTRLGWKVPHLSHCGGIDVDILTAPPPGGTNPVCCETLSQTLNFPVSIVLLCKAG